MCKLFTIFLAMMMSHWSFASGKELREKFIQDYYLNVESIKSTKDHYVGFEILVADSGAQAGSGFGHGLLRLVDRDQDWRNDVVISFGAFIGDEKVSRLKGLFGGYEIIPEINGLGEFWGRYVLQDKRKLKRFVPQFTEVEFRKILELLIKKLTNPEVGFGHYFFASNNCISIITSLFHEAGVTVKKKIINPQKTQKWMDESELSLYATIEVPSPDAVSAKLDSMDLINASLVDLSAELSDIDLAFAYMFYASFPSRLLKATGKYLREMGVRTSDVFNLNSLPESLYRKCQDKTCYEQIYRTEENALSVTDRLKTYEKRLRVNRALPENEKVLVEEIAILNLRNESVEDTQIIVEEGQIKLQIRLQTMRLIKILPFIIVDHQIQFSGKSIGRITGDKMLIDRHYMLSTSESENEFKMTLLHAK